MTNVFTYLFILFGSVFISLNYIVSNDWMISEQLEVEGSNYDLN